MFGSHLWSIIWLLLYYNKIAHIIILFVLLLLSIRVTIWEYYFHPLLFAPCSYRNANVPIYIVFRRRKTRERRTWLWAKSKRHWSTAAMSARILPQPRKATWCPKVRFPVSCLEAVVAAKQLRLRPPTRLPPVWEGRHYRSGGCRPEFQGPGGCRHRSCRETVVARALP